MLLTVAEAKAVYNTPIADFSDEKVHTLINQVAEINAEIKPLTKCKGDVSTRVKEYMCRTGQDKIVTDAGHMAVLAKDHDRLCAIDVEDAQTLVAEGKLSKEAFNLCFRDKRIAASLKIT